ncbi:ComEA family DNA-binding protein [Salinibacterium sp. M195]|uniref:ComEA family DNA-binding protein n=1 Tax=Salinibacterium sp. M195 TaxID=2583374 RepID=UPI00210582AE|nr:ComEA family DNA-binding protein [Salinibacterium sp. M195]QYH35934.1 ComEA family DNA-binding protein [Salinibacterium sp. M195]
MEEFEQARRARLRLRVGAVVVLVLVALGCAVLATALTARPEPTEISRAEPGENGVEASFGAPPVFVHVTGAVVRPGLFELADGSRVIDAIAAAGGFTATANRDELNLARLLTDGEQFAVPVEGEQSADAAASDSRVNLNTADAAALDTLPRVGPAMAARILAWRDANGRFASIDDLRSVSGIGDKTFEGLRELITV